MAAEPPRLRELLRSQRLFPDAMPEFDPDEVPDNPVTLFLRWLEAALKDAVPAPHAMTLATARRPRASPRRGAAWICQGRRTAHGPAGTLPDRCGQRQGPGSRP